MEQQWPALGYDPYTSMILAGAQADRRCMDCRSDDEDHVSRTQEEWETSLVGRAVKKAHLVELKPVTGRRLHKQPVAACLVRL